MDLITAQILGLMVIGGKSKVNSRFLAGPHEEGTINRHKEYRGRLGDVP